MRMDLAGFRIEKPRKLGKKGFERNRGRCGKEAGKANEPPNETMFLTCRRRREHLCTDLATKRFFVSPTLTGPKRNPESFASKQQKVPSIPGGACKGRSPEPKPSL